MVKNNMALGEDVFSHPLFNIFLERTLSDALEEHDPAGT